MKPTFGIGPFALTYLKAKNCKRILFKLPFFSENGVLLHVFYRDRTGIQYKRDIRYDWQDFVCELF